MYYSYFTVFLLVPLETKVCQDLRLEALIVRRALDRMILYLSILVWVGEVLTTLSDFLQFRMDVLQSSLDQRRLCILQL